MKESIENISEELLMEDEKITSYLKGNMSKEEETIFLQELKANPELKAKAIAMARLVKGLKDVRKDSNKEIKSELISASQEEIKEIAKNTIKPKKAKVLSFKEYTKWLSLAASIALIIWLGYGYYDYKKTTGLGNEYAEAFETSLITRGEEANNETQIKLQILFDNIKSDTDIEKTIHDLSICWELSIMETYNDYTEYSNEIGWYLSIGYLKNNDKASAKTILKNLIDKSDNSIIKEKVESILKQL